ncbi:hypothetical protein [Caulobacter sp. 17J80-11]|uniref:hypothetical protein n=1 Tax=Caulobacter sp. 17J80-11 TaxID=2763502 RepID=UPI001653EB8E|nr:hypothetical protein [Caulobacter sp. 17J80-11]MBC6980937.1 hypothetical protein [Caulobacter sp. 17J80-11]
MFDFERELKRILGVAAASDAADPSLLELLDARMLAGQGRAADIAAGRVSTRDPLPHRLEGAAIWREYARRTGDPAALRKSAAAAEAAGKASRKLSDQARAALEQGLTCLAGADLFGDQGLADTARTLLEAAAGQGLDAVAEARLETAYARLAARDAIGSGDYARALEAAALYDSAVHKLERLAADRGSPAVRLEAAAARVARAELLAIFGVHRKDARLLEGAARDVAQLVEHLDPDYEPLTWARAAELCGACLTALGALCVRVDLIAEGVSALVEIGERYTRDHSPLDWARFQHALGQALQALGEASDSDAAFEQAEVSYDEALDAAIGTALVMRATIASDRAACVARRAERRGDLTALARAEAAFRSELAGAKPEADPSGWAVIQANLGRLYEARAELLGEFRERDAAVYAYEAALDVFCEQGLRTLAVIAAEGLERVRAA